MCNLVRLIKEKKGAILIEFSVVFPCLILLFIFVLEMTRVMFIASSLNLVASDIARKTALTEDVNEKSTTYATIYYNELKNELPLWGVVTDKDSLNVIVKYCKSVQEVIDEKCANSLQTESNIIFYDISYKYNPLFASLFTKLANSSLTRRTIVYREFHS